VAFQAIQIVLAIGIVAAFASVQLGYARPHDLTYLLINLISSAGFAVTAVLSFQLGFVITNVMWAVVSAVSLTKLARTRRRRAR